MKRIKLIYFLPLMVLLQQCSSGPAVSNYNYAYLYDEKPAVPRPEFQVFHVSDSVSSLYFKFNSDNVLYSKPQTDTVFKAHLTITYRIYEWNNREALVDSMTVPVMDIGGNNTNQTLIGKIDLQVPYGNKYFLEIRIRDKNRDLTVLNYSLIDKLPNTNRQYFLIKDKDQKVVFGNVLMNDLQYTILKSRLVEHDKIKLETSNKKLPLAAPPFVEEVEENSIIFDPKSGHTELLGFMGDTLTFTPEHSQAHHFFPEQFHNEGFFLYHFRDGYPYITDAEQMIQALRYISSNEEFSKLQTSSNKKKAVDEYWLQIAGNKEKAREVMAAYYGRVENSNKYFTSYKEGWKTDRGIIYVIYGVPTTIYKTPTFESWIYGEESNVLSLHFKFRKIENKMSNNDYRLIRDIAMKPGWYRAVDSWRQGRINN